MKKYRPAILFSAFLLLVLVLSSAKSTALSNGRIGTIKEPLAMGTGLFVEDISGSLTPEDIANAIVGSGITVSNVVYSGTATATGIFGGGNDIIGFDEGIILSTGNVISVVGPNQSDSTTTVYGGEGDPDLTTLSGFETFDAAVLEFDFIPDENVVSFQFVFSSEEYNEFVNSTFNDVFAFFINGTNCAEVEGSPVSINTINFGDPYGTEPNSHPSLYVNNDLEDGGGGIDTEMDGLTVVLTCTAPVVAATTNHMKLAIADASDASHDSAVFIKAVSVTTARRPVILLPGLGASINYPCLFLGDDCSNDAHWQWMPTADSYYQPLIDRLAQAQYTEGNGFFSTFFYDWSEPLAYNVPRLKQLIDEVKATTGASEVDLVGHSMGGLVSRAYIQSNGYEHDVAHLVTLGSPHRGAADAYPYWEGGALHKVGVNGMWSVGLRIVLIRFGVFGSPDTPIMYVIRNKVSGIRDLLPTETYLYDEDTNQPHPEVQMVHRNTNLGLLNSSLGTLYDRTSLATFASTNVPETTERFIVRDRFFWEWPRWDDGVPVWSREDEFVTTFGDGTVPEISAKLEDPRVHAAVFSGVDHTDLAADNDIINAVLSFLGISVAPDAVDLIPTETLILFANGPTNVSVTGPSGLLLEESTASTIDYVTIPNSDFKLVIVTNPIEGDYSVQITGDGSGNYSLGTFDSAQDVPEVITEWDELWDSLATETQSGVTTEFNVSYTHAVSDTTQLAAVTPIVEKPIYWKSTVVTGRATPNSTVTLYDAESIAVLGAGNTDAGGFFTISVSTPLQLGQRVFAKVNGLDSVPVIVEPYSRVYLPGVSSGQ